ncbi:hypothetical protein [Citricoccus sp. SGAir0253]|uniref:hypothetical protein n=1 Tax=Citricoccus sp. SGAir0253 TaxID=2567881 RepID=UPI00143D525B|nr:hypothetical protein [Citricoccus sp. SGAir0253]
MGWGAAGAVASGGQPRELAQRAEREPVLPPGPGEVFSGYGVMGVPFASGHYLALRRFTASSIGPGYTSVWHRDPQGRWTVYATAAPEVSCAHYLGPAATEAHTCRIDLDWTGPRSLTVQIPGVLDWHLELAERAATRMMSAVGARLPAGTSHAGWLLGPLGRIAGPVLSAGRIRLHGRMPSGHAFGGVPRRVWDVVRTSAVLDGQDLGAPGPWPEQVSVGDLMLPQRGLFFADAEAVFVPPGGTGRASS